MNTIGNIIRKARLEKRISQGQLADYLSVAPNTICRWEINQTFPNAKHFLALCTFLQVPVSTFSDLYQDPNNKTILTQQEQIAELQADVARLTKQLYKLAALFEEDGDLDDPDL